MDYGFKISQDGYNVKTAETKNLVMTSKANQWKIHSQGVVTFTSTNQTINIAHGLGYTPAFLSLYHSKFWTATDPDRFSWTNSGAATSDGTNLKATGSDIDDQVMYVIFKDFGT